jgi:ribosomal protein L14
MVQKESYLRVCDKSGVVWVKLIHNYRGFSRRISYFGDFIKVTVRRLKHNDILKRKAKPKGLILRTRKIEYKKDGSFFLFDANNVILLKKRTTSYGQRIYGPTLRKLNRRKVLASCSSVL